jgi:ribosome-associated heat shock protein Hsp15
LAKKGQSNNQRRGGHSAPSSVVSGDDAPQNNTAKIRADKWLWHARFFKTRGLATKLISSGHLEVNGMKISKPAFSVGVGDVLVFSQARLPRTVRILAPSTRRGPAIEAQTLYEDLTPLPEPKNSVPETMGQAPKFDGKGRPTKKDRRNLAFSQRRVLD